MPNAPNEIEMTEVIGRPQTFQGFADSLSDGIKGVLSGVSSPGDGVQPAATASSFPSAIGSQISTALASTKVTLRPWVGEFFHLTRPTRLDMGTTVRNLSYFKWNYAAVDAGILTFGLVMNPTSLLCLLALGGGWCFFLSKNGNPEWRTVVGGVELSPYHRTLGMGVLSALVLTVMLGSLIFMLIGLGAVTNVLHAAAHQPTADYSRVLENEELGGAMENQI